MTAPIYGIIGTAGRDKSKPMTAQLYAWMVGVAKLHIPQGSHVGSGGAAWADHLAVTLMLTGWASALTLHFPAPFDQKAMRFVGPDKSAASAANYYHSKFSEAIHRHTLKQIAEVLQFPHVTFTHEPERADYKGMFARNSKVAKFEHMLAFTFGEGDVPADGGTKHTWDLCQGEKTHITLPIFE